MTDSANGDSGGDFKERARLLREVRLALQDDDHETAITGLQQIVALAEKRGDPAAQARHLGNLALTYHRAGQPEAALQSFQQAIVLARQAGDLLTENGLLGNMGNVLREIGRPQDAMHHLNRALLMAQQIGDQRGRGIWLSNLGLVYDDLGRHDEAQDTHRSAIKIARRMRDTSTLARRLGHYGASLIAAGQHAEAIAPLRESVTLYEQLGNLRERIGRLGFIGDLHAEMGRSALPDSGALAHFSDALGAYQEAMQLAHDSGNRIMEAEVIRSIGDVLADADQMQDAAQYYQVAEQMFAALGLKKRARRSRATLERIIHHLKTQT